MLEVISVHVKQPETDYSQQNLYRMQEKQHTTKL